MVDTDTATSPTIFRVGTDHERPSCGVASRDRGSDVILHLERTSSVLTNVINRDERNSNDQTSYIRTSFTRLVSLLLRGSAPSNPMNAHEVIDLGKISIASTSAFHSVDGSTPSSSHQHSRLSSNLSSSRHAVDDLASPSVTMYNEMPHGADHGELDTVPEMSSMHHIQDSGRGAAHHTHGGHPVILISDPRGTFRSATPDATRQIFAGQHVRLQNKWRTDVWIYMKNAHPFIALFTAHRWHPYKKRDRLLVFLIALVLAFLVCGLFATRDCCHTVADTPVAVVSSRRLDALSARGRIMIAEFDENNDTGSHQVDPSYSGSGSEVGSSWLDTPLQTTASTWVTSIPAPSTPAPSTTTPMSSSVSGSGADVMAVPSTRVIAREHVKFSLTGPKNGDVFGVSDTLQVQWVVTLLDGSHQLLENATFRVEFSPNGSAFETIASSVSGRVENTTTFQYVFDWDLKQNPSLACMSCALRVCNEASEVLQDEFCIRTDGVQTEPLQESRVVTSTQPSKIAFYIVHDVMECACGLNHASFVEYAYLIALIIPVTILLLEQLVTFYQDTKLCGLCARRGGPHRPRVAYYTNEATSIWRGLLFLCFVLLCFVAGIVFARIDPDIFWYHKHAVVSLWLVTFVLIMAIGFVYTSLVYCVLFTVRWCREDQKAVRPPRSETRPEYTPQPSIVTQSDWLSSNSSMV